MGGGEWDLSRENARPFGWNGKRGLVGHYVLLGQRTVEEICVQQLGDKFSAVEFDDEWMMIFVASTLSAKQVFFFAARVVSAVALME